MKAGRMRNRRRQPRNRRRFNARKLVWPLVSLAVVCGIAIGCYVLLTTPKLRITKLQVYGAKLVPASTIEANARVALNCNILTLSKNRILKRVMKHPEIKSVRIGRRLPRTVEIRVEERRPAAAATNGSGWWLVDEKGFPFHEVDSVPSALPVVELPPSTQLEAGRKVNAPAYPEAFGCLSAGRVAGYRVSKISVDQAGDLCLNIESDLYVKLGQPVQIEDKLKRVSRLLDRRPTILENGEYLDASCIYHEAWKKKSEAGGKPAQEPRVSASSR